MNIIKNFSLGFFSWLIPFGIAFLFYNPSGELTVPYNLFKSVMVVVSTISGCFLLYLYFRPLNSGFLTEALVVGFAWLVINIVLDVFLLMPIMKVSFHEYLKEIGIRYLSIPIISMTIGLLLKKSIT